MMIRLCVRGWRAGAKEPTFEDRVAFSENEASTLVPKLAKKHASLLAGEGMIEIEFLDEPDPDKRFFRVGTDPSRMVAPIAISPKAVR